MPITTNFHQVYFASILSDLATKKLHKMYDERFPNKQQQIFLGNHLSELVEKYYSFLPYLKMRIIADKVKESPLCYVEVDE
ncbi:hypothetical protein JXB27_01920 [Candidatus Woesearchaeota archaeon]|nr:hypothetical protein [Candidatus Woesearchaeota archaeon]